MCGLIGVFKTEKGAVAVNEQALMQFEDQRKRGTEGFGIITIDPKMNVEVNRATEPYKFMWDIHNNLSSRIIVHHRTPTSTDNLIGQTHPITINDESLKYNYLVTHNGIITNDDELKTKHETFGFQYKTEQESYYKNEIEFNDSESFAIELAMFAENQTTELDIRGSAAFIALQLNKKTNKVEKLLFGRTSTSPLKMAKTRNKLFLSSEGQGQDIEEKIMYSCKLDDKMKLTKTKLAIKEIPTIYTAPDTTEKTAFNQHTLPIATGFHNSRSNNTIDDTDFEEGIVSIIDDAKDDLNAIVEEYIIDLSTERIPTTGDNESYIKSMKDIMDDAQKSIESSVMDKTLADHQQKAEELLEQDKKN